MTSVLEYSEPIAGLIGRLPVAVRRDVLHPKSFIG